MDYSLLVGVEEDRGGVGGAAGADDGDVQKKGKSRLVVGIIDYIRQYTWDKQLETYVKSSGVLGGGTKQPTIISPKLYKRRFRSAMKQYLVTVPGPFTTPTTMSAADAVPDIDEDTDTDSDAPLPPSRVVRK
jgi:hypothetical protein